MTAMELARQHVANEIDLALREALNGRDPELSKGYIMRAVETWVYCADQVGHARGWSEAHDSYRKVLGATHA